MIKYIRGVYKKRSGAKGISQKIFYESLLIEIVGIPLLLMGIIFKIFEIKGYGQLLTVGALTLTVVYAILSIISSKYEKFETQGKRVELYYRMSLIGSAIVSLGTSWIIMKWSYPFGYLIILPGLILLILVVNWSRGINSKNKFQMNFQKRAVAFTLIGLWVTLSSTIKTTFMK